MDGVRKNKGLVMKQHVRNRLLNIMIKKIKFYPNLDNEFGGHLQYQEMLFLYEQGVEIINKDMYDFYVSEMKNGINGGGWLYFKEGKVKDKLRDRLNQLRFNPKGGTSNG